MNAVETPFRNNQTMMPGNTIDFSQLDTQILLDENLENYTYIHEWLVSFRDMDVWHELTKDIKLHILSANKRPLLTFTFVHAFPTNLGEVTFDSTQTDFTQMVFSVQWSYQFFTFKRDDL